MANWPEGYPDAAVNAKIRRIFEDHAAAIRAAQSEDGRWHQLVNDTRSYLETSVTAMALTALARGVRAGLLARSEYAPVIERAWAGLVRATLPNGTVTGVSCGLGIQASKEAYYNRSSFYQCSGPGGAGAVFYAAVELAKGY
jgi:rhamnogalacturonyl hydrolase YesR